MKNKFSFLFFLLLGASALFSQTSTYTRQIGIDAAGLLGQIIGSGNSGSNAFYFSYRKSGEKTNRRLGLGASLSLQGGNGNTTTTNTVSFRSGKEYFQDFGKNWRAFYGWDLRLHFLHNSDLTDNQNSASLELGPAPVVGLQFRLNERLSLSTEAAYNLFFTLDDSSGNTRLGIATYFSPPVALYAQFDF